jgi:CO/xanthine dehydrogenase FAD-binding subunit
MAEVLEVYTARNLNQLLQLRATYPEAFLTAGATEVMRLRMIGRAPRSIIDLTRVPELSRISRTERWLDIGAAVPIARVLSVGRHVIPRALHSSLEAVGTPAIRSQATIGGNLCLATARADSLAALVALGARVEVRSVSSTRWTSVDRFVRAEGVTDLEPNEVVTRVRVPLLIWDVQVFRKVSSKGSPSPSILNVCVLARVQKDAVDEIRLAATGLYRSDGEPAPVAFRDRALELVMAGQRLPVSERAITQYVRVLLEHLRAHPNALPPDSYAVQTALRVFAHSIERLGRDRIYS